MSMIEQVYLNGNFVAAESARVSAFDRGFIFGDGVYEVIPVFGRKPFRLPQHLDRLERSLGALSLPNPITRDGWQEVVQQLIDGNAAEDQYLYIQITRGSAPRDHSFPENTEPTVFAYSQTLHYPDAATLAAGVAAITVDDIRWARCDIKATALLANVLMRQQAKEQGVMEAILIRDGMMTEGAASNIFAVVDDCLYTAPKSTQILPGITRDLVVELAKANDICCREEAISAGQLRNASEVWMTSSTKEILPITRVDNQAVGDGKPGKMHKHMLAIYQDYKQAFREGQVH